MAVSISSFSDGQNTLSLALLFVDSTSGCPLCSTSKYSERRDEGITALLPLTIMLSSAVSLSRKLKNGLTSRGTLLAHLGHPL